MSYPTKKMDLEVLQLEADLFDAMNFYKDTFDMYLDKFPTLEISADNQEAVINFMSGFKTLTEGLQLMQQSMVALCQLKSVPLA
jgi:hypothetical protein